MIFEIGKIYKHTTGFMLKVLCEAETTAYGKTLLAETNGTDTFMPVCETEDAAVNFEESTEEEWMKNFS